MVNLDIPGYKEQLFVADLIAENLDRVKKSVLLKGWDYVAIVSGIPGVGKSTFAQSVAKYLDPNFESWQICFTAKEFREKTSVGKKGQAFILDESFADMNSTLSKDPEFIATMNHLQLLRQKNLFIFLILPDFFSLNKTIAVFRASHLFVPYANEYNRGTVAVFGRDTKRTLYFKGKQFCDYHAAEPNFRTVFQGHWFCDFADYENRKNEHLLSQTIVKEKDMRSRIQRDKIAGAYVLDLKATARALSERVKENERTVEEWVNKGKERLNRLSNP